ncbi:Maf family protein [Halobacillus litoralis]|uniref:Maf family protein n=1 Tax=Halobacillus litoralis TaxID=45668 RepID=UPI001CD49479|nr:Maf family protein [Halobacillus litoralis]MCA0969933.1 Maf family protein [Halobacillus litoralis]
MRTLVLGSNSPRRKELLKKAGYTFTVRASNVDETLPDGISPEQAVLMLAERKSDAIGLKEGEVLLTSDTVVAKGHSILGKPADVKEAETYLRLLSGDHHEVWTAVTLRSLEKTESFAVQTSVKFFPLDDSEIAAYIESGETWDKAGGYGIQGKGALFVEEIHGDYYSVVGLPLSRVVRALRAFDVSPS